VSEPDHAKLAVFASGCVARFGDGRLARPPVDPKVGLSAVVSQGTEAEPERGRIPDALDDLAVRIDVEGRIRVGVEVLCRLGGTIGSPGLGSSLRKRPILGS
jgi:hypothetical protein